MYQIFVQYAKKLLIGPEPNLAQSEGIGTLEEVPTKAVTIEIEFTRKYFGESIENLPGKQYFFEFIATLCYILIQKIEGRNYDVDLCSLNIQEPR